MDCDYKSGHLNSLQVTFCCISLSWNQATYKNKLKHSVRISKERFTSELCQRVDLVDVFCCDTKTDQGSLISEAETLQ